MPEGEAITSLDHAFEEAAFLRAARSGAWPQFDAPRPAAALSFLRQFHDDALAGDLEGLGLADVLNLAAGLWRFALLRGDGPAQTRIRPGEGADGRRLERDIVEIVSTDRPFLVSSVMADFAAHGLDVLAMFHPIVAAEDGGRADSMIQVHLAPLLEEQREALMQSLAETLDDVRAATDDWKAMLGEMDAAIAELDAAAPPVPDGDKAEALEFLRWLRDEHFAFFGARAYRFRDAGKGAAPIPEIVEGTSFGILRDPVRAVLRPKSEQVLTRDFLREPTPVVVAKSNMRSRVHRRAIADYVSVKRYSPAGEVIGERRFVGLFTAEAYDRMARDVPLIRRKIRYVLDRAAKLPGSHSARKLRSILENYPRDELFQIAEPDLLKTALGVLHLEDRPRPRLFLRHDRFDRFVSALVYLPRERYSAELRAKIGELLREAYWGRLSAYYPHFSEGPLARVQYIIGLEPGEHPNPDLRRMEQAIAALTKSWEDSVERRLRAPDVSAALRAAAARYVPAFSAGYRERFGADEALADIAKMEALGQAPEIQVHAFASAPASAPAPGADSGGARELRFKIYHRGAPVPLSRVMPILETAGLDVIWEQGYRIAAIPEGVPVEDEDCIWIHDFQTLLPAGADAQDEGLRARFETAFTAVWRGESEADRFNALVIAAGAGWRDAAFLRALARWRHQSGVETSETVYVEALAAHPDIARLLVALRDARFDPDAFDGGEAGMAARTVRCDELAAEIEAALDGVASLDFDRTLRRLLHVIQATLRTNFYQRGADGVFAPHISLKIASAEIADLPAPKPHREIFVWSPEVEGVHLRFGAVARGGLRWSDRRDDFRTEVLGLVKAQQVKNAVITPAGAKGGFYPKQLPKEGGREAVQAAAIEAYKRFIRGLLDLTDNLEGSAVAPPPRVVRWDGDDPYLVVAADKGTATFSDIANGVAQEYGFWLGDAFASGGSAGYDHKAMGITARGAWEAVKRHFRELDKDIQAEPFTVIGVGDMSGDVFGNGMLLSEQTRLLAAFDHRDIFIDPDPDPAKSHAERARLFALPRSSWQDYDARLISEGGGVFSRAAKSVPLTPQMRALTGLSADSVTPLELIRALLAAPCELLWFGGIGAYVKARDEHHWEVGDKTNDGLRVDAADVRAMVIGEGANLGVTQRGRIEFARKGGRINTDAIDNSAGVDTSDHEVNIKILLDAAIKDGALGQEARTPLLAGMTDDVARLVLGHNYDQTLAITLAQHNAAADLDAHERLMLRLEAEGRIDRAVDTLPSAEEIVALREAGQGLTRPEIAVLAAHAKIALKAELAASPILDDPHFEAMLCAYFPARLARFAAQMRAHPLRREIVATRLAGDMVDLGGPAFVLRVHEMTGAGTAGVARAFEAARRIFRYDALIGAVNALDNRAPALAQILMQREMLDLLRRQTQILARRMRGASGEEPRSVDSIVSAYRDGAGRLKAMPDTALSPFQRERVRARCAELIAVGAPDSLARETGALPALTAATDIIDLAEHGAWPVEAAALLYHALGGRFSLDEMRDAADTHLPPHHWSRLAARRMVEGLYTTQRRLAGSVIAFVKEAGGPLAEGAASPDAAWAEAALAAWLTRNAEEADRADAALAELVESGPWTLSKVAIAEAAYREFADIARP